LSHGSHNLQDTRDSAAHLIGWHRGLCY